MQLIQGFKYIIDGLLLFLYLFIHNLFKSIVLMRECFLQFAYIIADAFLYEIFLDFALPEQFARI